MFEFLFGHAPQNTVSPRQAKQKLDAGGVLLLDVRTPGEYAGGHIPNSISLPLDALKSGIARVAPQKDAALIVYCQSGGRASQACAVLSAMGYTNVENLGGICDWPYEVTR